MITEYKNKIVGFYHSHKRMPSYAEIMALVGFKSKNAVYKLVNKLVEEGILSKDSSGRLIPNKLVGEVPLLGLVEAGFPSVAEGSSEMASFDTLNIDEYLIGGKGAGSTYLLEVKGDSMIDEGIREGDLVIAERTAAFGGTTGLEPKDGDIVIANVDDGWTMKYFRKRSRPGSRAGSDAGSGPGSSSSSGQGPRSSSKVRGSTSTNGSNATNSTETIYLEPANKNYKPIYPQQNLKIAAIVKGVIRKY